MPAAANTPYPFHKIALRPLLPDATPQDLQTSVMAGTSQGEAEFTAFLFQQGLAPLWDECIEQHGNNTPQKFRDALHQARLHATGGYLIQHNRLREIKNILDEATVPHVVMKGAHTRELYYHTPALRPALDIDVLVSTQNKIAAIKAFRKHGYGFHGVAENISHEASLIQGKTSIDLHWDILRPGRTRCPMANTLLDTRQDFGSHWGMSVEATLFMMLVHPVFTKYSTTAHATLVRLLDIAYLLDKEEINWTLLIGWLEQAGLKTAAWVTLTWAQMLTEIKPPNEAATLLKPGKLKQRYLRQWLNLPKAHLMSHRI